jgi:protein TonB
MPRVLKEVKPRYPSAAREAGKSAVVILDCVVTREGRPSRVRVRTGGGAAFDRAAMTALRQWRFEPGLRDGKPVPVRLEIELTFTAK